MARQVGLRMGFLLGISMLLIFAAATADAGVLARAGLLIGAAVSVLAAATDVRQNKVERRLAASLEELKTSRDHMRSNLERLGDTLRATHDLTSLLGVVLETSVHAMKAKAGAVYLVSNTRTELTVRCAHNLDRDLAHRRLRVGEGIAGRVAQTRAPLLLPSKSPAPAPSDAEPQASTMIAVPLESATQLVGVLAMYGREIDEPFTQNDLEMVMSLARQAAVGIENVLLHQEAQRLSITDGMTGVWNRRYLNMRLAQEVERSIRFRRPLSLLLLDVDKFKAINDRYGHQRGDAVLIELAHRVVRAVRGQVDTVARLGGEEFVLILPETPSEGASIVGRKILDAVSSEPFGVEGEDPIWVTVSIGCATFPQHGTTPQPLLRAADFAMYEAKNRGRNRLVLADELDGPPAESNSGSVEVPASTRVAPDGPSDPVMWQGPTPPS